MADRFGELINFYASERTYRGNNNIIRGSAEKSEICGNIMRSWTLGDILYLHIETVTSAVQVGRASKLIILIIPSHPALGEFLHLHYPPFFQQLSLNFSLFERFKLKYGRVLTFTFTWFIQSAILSVPQRIITSFEKD